MPCVVGKSMAISRRALDAIGGFAAFVDVLAEDQAIGCAVRDAGLKVALSPVVVRNVTTHRPLGRALARQARWGKIRFAFSKLTYTGELLLNPFPIALLACAAAALLAPRALTPAALLAGVLLLLRLAQGFALARATRADHSAGQLLLLPVKDVLQLVTQAVPVPLEGGDWQGHRARLGPGTLLLPSRHAAWRRGASGGSTEGAGWPRASVCARPPRAPGVARGLGTGRARCAKATETRSPNCTWRGSPRPLWTVPSKLKSSDVDSGFLRFLLLKRLKHSTMGSIVTGPATNG